MYKVQTYQKARQLYFNDNISLRKISKELGINRRSLKKMIDHSSPPGYQRVKVIALPMLGSHKEWIDEILENDKKNHRKQRHTAMRIFNRLKQERDYKGGYTIVREYVANKRQKTKEMFVPLEHSPGMAQADFGEADIKLKGQLVRIHYFTMQLPFSDGIFVKAYMTENTESFCDGHVSAFEFFSGVPKRILYDNTKIAVSKILQNKDRDLTRGFTALQSHYLFESGFANLAKGNEKGGVENMVGFTRRNFMVPIPEFDNLDDFNTHLAAGCKEYTKKINYGHTVSVGQRLALEAFKPLPAVAFQSYSTSITHVNSQGLVRFKKNDYSVPTNLGQVQVLVKGYVDEVVICYNNSVVAKHRRLYGSEQVNYDPLHYLSLLERKIAAFEQAAPLKNWQLPSIFAKIEAMLYRKDGNNGRRCYIRILMLLKTYRIKDLETACAHALELEMVNEIAILHLLRRNIEGRPLNLAALSDHIPIVEVKQTDLSAYSSLLNPNSNIALINTTKEAV